MKRAFYLAVASALFFSHCNKHVEKAMSSQTPPPPPPPIKHLFANAGADTTICMPYGGTGSVFIAILNGRASYDDSGKIVSYSWSEIGGIHSYIDSANNDTTLVTLIGTLTLHHFQLEVQDDHGQVDRSEVTINVIQQFDSEYDGLSWDSTTGILTTIGVKAQPGLIESWPDFTLWDNDNSKVYLTDFNGKCSDISSWKKLPYVPYDSIQLTDKLVFYSLISIPPSIVEKGTLYPEIYAKSNSGIDFNQKVSVGFIAAYPPQGW